MKSDTPPVPEQPSAPREKRAINPWLLVVGAVLGGVVLIATVLVALVWLAPQRQLSENEKRMPDGTVLKIEAVTWGKVHWCEFECPPSQPWAFWDRRTEPVRDSASGPASFQEPPELKIWMTHRAARSSQLLPFDWWGGSSVVNSLGVEVADFNPQHLHLEPTRVIMLADARPFGAIRREGEEWLVNSSFPTFRTDSGKFRLRVKDTSGEVIAEFDLIHPSPPPVKDWQAEELPVTKTDGNLAVTLKRVQRPSEIDRSKGLLWRFGLEEIITENGLPTKDWYFSQSLDDPFGNTVHFGPKSFTGESAWRLRLGGRRSSDAEFPASETWALADVPLPPRDSVQFRSDTHSIDGVTFKLALVAGSGHVSYSTPRASLPPESIQGNPVITTPIFETPANIKLELDDTTCKIEVEASWPHIGFEMIGQSQGQEVLIKARDSQGRAVDTRRSHGLPNLRTYFFKTEPDAKSLTLLFIVSRGREFEFFIKPPELSDEKPKP